MDWAFGFSDSSRENILDQGVAHLRCSLDEAIEQGHPS